MSLAINLKAFSSLPDNEKFAYGMQNIGGADYVASLEDKEKEINILIVYSPTVSGFAPPGIYVQAEVEGTDYYYQLDKVLTLEEANAILSNLTEFEDVEDEDKFERLGFVVLL